MSSVCRTSSKDAPDRLTVQMASYARYHQHPINRILHVLTVPLLLWSFLVLCTYSSEMPTSVWSANPSLFVIAVYTLYYASFGILSCFSWLLGFGWPLWMMANFYRLSVPRAWPWALAVHLLAGFLQWHFGHGIYEKRKPVGFDAIFQQVLIAPLSVWYEILFAFGCCLHLKHQVQAQMQQDRSR